MPVNVPVRAGPSFDVAAAPAPPLATPFVNLRRLLILASMLVAVSALARPARAQGADVIRGRVVDPDSNPVANFQV